MEVEQSIPGTASHERVRLYHAVLRTTADVLAATSRTMQIDIPRRLRYTATEQAAGDPCIRVPNPCRAIAVT